jgi:hypothetical protein
VGKDMGMRRRTEGLLGAIVSAAGRWLPEATVLRLADQALRARHRLNATLRQRAARRDPSVTPPLVAPTGERLVRSLLESRPPWHAAKPRILPIPGMLTSGEERYYEYITRFYSGCGEAVEVGSWLGRSTAHLALSLREQGGFRGKRLHVFDDFVWRSEWMTPALAGTELVPPSNHATFLPLFESQVREFADLLTVTRGRLVDFDGNEEVEPIRWNGSPIELIVVDCGRSLSVNEAWWRIFQPSLIPDRSLVVMQDWGHYASVPEVWWENTKVFTDHHASELDLVHELADGSLATFLYRQEVAVE